MGAEWPISKHYFGFLPLIFISESNLIQHWPLLTTKKISLYFRQLIQDIQSILINKLSFLVSMARLGEAIKCYSFQSWPLEPILRDPLCIMKMVHMMITKKTNLICFKSFVFFDLFTSYSRAGESVSAWQRRWEPSKGPESRSRTVYAKLESNSEPDRARVCQRVAVRASESQSGSHREP